MSTFLLRKCFAHLFSNFGFVIFWQKNIGAKATRKRFYEIDPRRASLFAVDTSLYFEP